MGKVGGVGGDLIRNLMSIEQFPFIKGDLEEADFGEMSQPVFGMWEIQGREDIVVREESDRVKSRYGQTKKGLKDRVGVYNNGKKLFQGLKNKYNINIIPFDYVIGKTNPYDNPQIFTVTKKIFGKNLRDINEQDDNILKDEKLFKEAEHTISSLTKYAKDEYDNKGTFLNDIFHYHQYVFGKIANGKEKKLHLVDIEPLYIDIKKVSSNQERLRDKLILETILSLQLFIMHMEQLTHRKLISARKELDNLLEYVSCNCGIKSASEISENKIGWEKMTKYNKESGLYKE